MHLSKERAKSSADLWAVHILILRSVKINRGSACHYLLERQTQHPDASRKCLRPFCYSATQANESLREAWRFNLERWKSQRSDPSWVKWEIDMEIVGNSSRKIAACHGISSWLTVIVASILFASHARQIGAFPGVCWY